MLNKSDLIRRWLFLFYNSKDIDSSVKPSSIHVGLHVSGFVFAFLPFFVIFAILGGGDTIVPWNVFPALKTF